ncbi:hypothetical protein [Streptomyces narbonensis]
MPHDREELPVGEGAGMLGAEKSFGVGDGPIHEGQGFPGASTAQ